MKIQHFFSVTMFSLLMLGLSYAPSVSGMGAAFGEVTTDVAETVGRDAEGVAEKADAAGTEAAKDSERLIEGGNSAAIKGTRQELLLGDGTAFVDGTGKDAAAEQQAEKQAEQNEEKATAPKESSEFKDKEKTAKKQLDSLSDSNRAVGSVRKSIGKVTSNVEEGLGEFSKVLKKYKGDIAQVTKRYSDKLDNLDDDVLKQAGTSKEELEELLKSSDAAVRKKACLKVIECDSLKGLIEESGTIARNGGTKFQELTDALNDEMKVVREKFSKLEENPDALDHLTDEVETTEKDAATGAAVKTTNLKVFMKDFGSGMEEVQSKLDGISNDISIEQEGLVKDFGFSKNWSKTKSFFSDGAINDSFKSMRRSFKSVTKHDAWDGLVGGTEAVGRGLKNIGGKILQGAEMVVSGVMFMIPNIFQSSLLAQKQRQAELQTLAIPINVGGWVLQIPDSCIDIANPESSFPLYVRIPVANIGDPLSQTYVDSTGKKVTLISGPNTNNAISDSIHTAGALILSGGSDLSAKPNRYKIHDAYFTNNPSMVLAYFAPGSYSTWGSVQLTSSQWTSGQVIDISNGLVINGDGDVINTMGTPGLEPYPLVTPADWHTPQPPQPLPSPVSIKEFLPMMSSKLSSLSDKTTYIQYGAGITSGPTASGAITALFENKNFDNQGIRDSKDKLLTPCVITAAYNAYGNGLSFTSATATTAERATMMKTSLAKNLSSPVQLSLAKTNASKVVDQPQASSPETSSSAPILLKSVLPVYGWGDQTYEQVMSGIPAASLLSPAELAQAFGGITAVSAKGVETPKFAADVNYAAQACWVYLSADTPFAQAVQNIVNARATNWTATGPVVDYIMFLDGSSNPAPLLKPIQTVDSTGTTIVSIGLNPDVVYWTSLIAYSHPDFQDASGNPLMYNMKGAALSDTRLGGKKGIIGSFITEFSTSFGGSAGTKANANLYGQFEVHKQTLLGIYNNGPFKYGNDHLSMSDTYNLTVPGSSGGAAQAEINFYTGTNCFGTSGAVSDLLVAMDGTWNGTTLNNGSSAVLPDSNATMFYSLITDIGYLVQPDGSLLATDFSQAPFVQDENNNLVKPYSIISNLLKSTTANPSPGFNVLSNMLESGLESNFPLPTGTTSYISSALMKYVTTQRQVWAQLFDGTAQGVSQKQGVTLGALTCTMPAAMKAKAAVASKCYVYEISPSPSVALCDHDLFGIVNSAAPALNGLSLQDAHSVNAATATVVSLITGFLFDTQGNQLMQKDGVTPRRLIISPADLNSTSTSIQGGVQCAASAIYHYMTTKYPLNTIAPSADSSGGTLVQKWKDWMSVYETQMNRLSGPYSFGGNALFIRSGDLAIGNAVYVVGTHPHSDFTPQDVFVAYSEKTQTTGGMISSSTNHILSLISGQLYDAKGIIGIRLPSAIVQSTTQTLQSTGLWGTWLTETVNTLQEAMNKRLAEQEKQQQEIDNLEENLATAQKITNDFVTPQAVQALVKRLQPGGTKGLPVPYSLLQYDPVKQIFVHVSPASTTNTTDMLYLFFDVGTDSSSGTEEPVGAVYDNKGVMHRAVRGIELQAMRDQFGVIVNADGTQTLGIPMTQPSLYMTDEDKVVTSKLGADSTDFDFISSTALNFPGGSIAMKLGYSLYFSKTMGSYYVYDSKNKQWVSIAGGHLYTDNGAPFAVSQKVAMRQKSSSKKNATESTLATADDMILLYENQKGNLQGYMSDGNDYVNIDQINQSKGAMTWETLSAAGTSFTVTQSGTKNKTYTVAPVGVTTEKTTSSTYVVDDSYEWYDLVYVPIDSKGNLLTTLPSSSYKSAEIVMKGIVPSHVIFNQIMYKNSSSAQATTYTMVPVNSAVGDNRQNITLTVDEDPNTIAPRVTIADGATVYYYCYVFDQLDADQLDKLRTTVIRGSIAPSVIALPVGPFLSISSGLKDAKGNAINVTKPASTTRVIFAKDIPLKSSSLALAKIAIADINSIPKLPASTDPLYVSASQARASLAENIALVFKSTDGRFFAQIAPSNSTDLNALTFSYVTNGAYVDLQTGVLFDLNSGICLEYCLNLDDWISVLNTAQVSVVSVTNTKTTTLSLVYRSPQAMKIQLAQLESDVSTPSDVSTSSAKVLPAESKSAVA